jgi:HSP20 family molecular chaperone IbpA
MAHNDSMTCSCAESTNATCAPNTNGATRVEQSARTTFRPAVDVLDGEDAYRIVADLPGSSAERVNITFEDGVLTLDAQVPDRNVQNAETLRQEYGVGAFHRRFRVHGEVDPDAISATYAQGVLTVTLPKATRSQRRRVPVNAN